MIVILQVIAHDKRRTIGTASFSAQTLARAQGFDRDPVVQANHVDAPGGTLAGGRGIVVGEQFIGRQFELEVLQMSARLLFGIGDDPNVGLPAFDGRTEGVGQRADRAFGTTARPNGIELRAGSVVIVSSRSASHWCMPEGGFWK